MTKIFIGRYVKSSADLHEPWIFPTTFRKVLKYQISWKFVL